MPDTDLTELFARAGGLQRDVAKEAEAISDLHGTLRNWLEDAQTDPKANWRFTMPAGQALELLDRSRRVYAALDDMLCRRIAQMEEAIRKNPPHGFPEDAPAPQQLQALLSWHVPLGYMAAHETRLEIARVFRSLLDHGISPETRAVAASLLLAAIDLGADELRKLAGVDTLLNVKTFLQSAVSVGRSARVSVEKVRAGSEWFDQLDRDQAAIAQWLVTVEALISLLQKEEMRWRL